MIVNALVVAAIIMVLLTFVGLYRAFKGPTAADRVVVINMITTKVTVITIGMFNRRYESSIIKSDALIYTTFITLILLFMFIFGVI
ncbi:MAG: cation:proton antiporter [Acholeplasmataceae bacterium]|nr:MAG: cation:proton antiporter [Acholeplasmataceae bacterium]